MESRSSPAGLTDDQAREYLRCQADPWHFLTTYGYVLNPNVGDWVRFDLWPAQRWALKKVLDHRKLIILKARQIGWTWLSLGVILWEMVYHPVAICGIFSRTENDAIELLHTRLKGMYAYLPAWMREDAQVVGDNKSRWELTNGSTCYAFSTLGGRGFTFSTVLVDEADFQPDLDSLMTAVKPTIDAGGRMLVISTSDKSQPESRFKRMYRAAKKEPDYFPLFLPWQARPERTQAWYEAEKRRVLAETGALDDIWQEYPATDTEALAPRSLDKRIPPDWIESLYDALDPLSAPAGAPVIPGLEIYRLPERGRRYCIGADPAEGNPTSDPSAATVLDVLSGEEVAVIEGRLDPMVFAGHLYSLARFYRMAPVLVERNNHGHAVLLWLEEHARGLRILTGYEAPGSDAFDAKRLGWLNNRLGKTIIYDALADAFRDRTTILHSFRSYIQIASIDGTTLKAPDGAHDDRADSYALANKARELAVEPAHKVARVAVPTR